MDDFPHTFNLAVHSSTPLHDYLVDILTFSAMLDKALEFAPQHRKFDGVDIVFRARAYQGGGLLAVQLTQYLDAITTGKFPSLIFLRFTRATVQDGFPPAPTIRKLEARMQFASFALYFDKVERWLTSIPQYSDKQNWPSALSFARVVRNAIVHNGIAIRNPKAKPVSWEGVTYDHSHNGRQFYPEDLDTGDILLLMWMTQMDLSAISEETSTPFEI